MSRRNLDPLAQPFVPTCTSSVNSQANSAASSVKICNLNCRSIMNKQAAISAIIAIELIDIVCLTETWLNCATPDAALTFPGYNLFRRDRDNCKTPWCNLGGGGVAILVKNTLIAARCPDLEIPEIEMITVKVTLGTVRK